jgi:hypothetical protein
MICWMRQGTMRWRTGRKLDRERRMSRGSPGKALTQLDIARRSVANIVRGLLPARKAFAKRVQDKRRRSEVPSPWVLS